MTSHDRCAAACGECQRICDLCADHCNKLLTEGKKEHATTLSTYVDCADVCMAAARIVSRRGPFIDTICKACNRCGKECEKYPDDDHMHQCADVCRKCEKACREMLGAHQEHAPPK